MIAHRGRACLGRRQFQRLAAATREDDVEACLGQCDRRRPADAAAGARDNATGSRSGCFDPAAKLVLDVDTDDLVEACLRPEPECLSALRGETARPGAHDPQDPLVRFPPDEPDGVVAAELGAAPRSAPPRSPRPLAS